MKRWMLVAYSLLITMLSTAAVLGVALRPDDGWTPHVQAQWQAWFGEERLHANPQIEPLTPSTHAQMTGVTPNEPRYQIQAHLDEGAQMIRGTATVTLPRQRLDEIPFYLYSPDETPIHVYEATLNGLPAQVDATAKLLTVHAPKSDLPQTISFRFETKLPERPTRTGAWKGTYTISYWYPILAVERGGQWMPRPDFLGFGDPYLMDMGTYEVELNTPADLRWYTSGALVGDVPQADGRKVLKWAVQNVRNFALVGGRQFYEKTFETGTGTFVSVATLSPSTLPKTAELAQSAVKTYMDKFGLSPYPVISVVELPAGTVYAHELPNLALFSQDLWGYPDPEHWIVHEIGHIWFYNNVGNYETEEPWLDEGLADYAAILEQEIRLGVDAYRAHIAESWDRFKRYQTYTPYRKGTPITVPNGVAAAPYGAYPNSQAHYYYNYLRPILMYHDIRQHMGDDAFYRFLRQYYAKNVGRTATRADLEQALADIDPNMLSLLKMWLDMPNDELLRQVWVRFGG